LGGKKAVAQHCAAIRSERLRDDSVFTDSSTMKDE
jgi:hypothetical protein